MSRVTKTWLWLVSLSAATTLLAASGLAGAGLTLAVLALSGIKAHLILRDFLRLGTAPGWMTGFDLGLAGLILAFSGLALFT